MIDPQLLRLVRQISERAKALHEDSVVLSEKAANLATLMMSFDDLLTADQPAAGPISLLDILETNDSARWPFPNWDRPLSKIRYMTIHHSAGQRATQNIRWWHRYHTGTKGWSRVGYHFGIAALDPGDPIELYQMNHLETHSWHDSRNTDTFGVCFAGDLRAGRDERPNDVQFDAFGRLCAWLFELDLPNWTGIVGHKSFGRTACPGDLRVWGDDLIDAAALYGCDIGGMFGATAEAILAIHDDGPMMLDYDEHSGMGE
jgi:hypothetical protein